MAEIENTIIIGSGPAGYTAALYTSRANLSPLVVEGFAWGGLLQQTTDVENYPGFPEGIMGPELMTKLRDQAERFGAKLETERSSASSSRPSPAACTRSGSATPAPRAHRDPGDGRRAQKLGVPGEEVLGGRGVSYCATCDAAFFKRRPDRDRRWRRLGDGGGDLPVEVRLEGRDGAPPRRVPRLEDHARARARARTSSCSRPTR